jgi:hypothetical protein
VPESATVNSRSAGLGFVLSAAPEMREPTRNSCDPSQGGLPTWALIPDFLKDPLARLFRLRADRTERTGSPSRKSSGGGSGCKRLAHRI